jgi:hypothetical protein
MPFNNSVLGKINKRITKKYTGNCKNKSMQTKKRYHNRNHINKRIIQYKMHGGGDIVSASNQVELSELTGKSNVGDFIRYRVPNEKTIIIYEKIIHDNVGKGIERYKIKYASNKAELSKLTQESDVGDFIRYRKDEETIIIYIIDSETTNNEKRKRKQEYVINNNICHVKHLDNLKEDIHVFENNELIIYSEPNNEYIKRLYKIVVDNPNYQAIFMEEIATMYKNNFFVYEAENQDILKDYIKLFQDGDRIIFENSDRSHESIEVKKVKKTNNSISLLDLGKVFD